MTLDATHDPARRSWIAAANEIGAAFPLQNLPFGIFRRKGSAETPRGGVAIGEEILDLGAAQRAGLFSGAANSAAQAAGDPTLNRLMGLGRSAARALRQALSQLLGAEAQGLAERERSTRPHLVAISAAELLLPTAIGDYTDFFASIHHATNTGRMMRPDNPLMPNYKWIPIGYHGRASSIVPSGTDFRRPKGQIRPGNAEAPFYAPSRALDYEAELAFYAGAGNALGEAIPVAAAEDHIFGFSLLNDWSARDIQGWEGQPLGPFLGKSFATTVSPWVVTMDALAPFRFAPAPRPAGDPAPLPYLAEGAAESGLDIAVEVLIRTPRMRQENTAPHRLGLCNAKNLYWTVAQMLAHHASNGCNIRPGDIMASGTLSGPGGDALGCMLELTKRGSEPAKLGNGEERRFLEDGDEIIMRGRCERAGQVGIGFGEVRGTVLPAG